MSTIVAILPALDAQFVMAAIEALVFKNSSHDSEIDSHAGHEHDMRSMDMKRADAFSEIARLYLESHEVQTPSAECGLLQKSGEQFSQSEKVNGAQGGSSCSTNRNAPLQSRKLTPRRPITVNVTIDLPTLLGLAENPGQLSGYGAIPASLARELASNSQWRRFITDPKTGALLDYGRETYEPPKPLVDYLLARDRTCRFPGCRAPARLADLDHAQSWDSGGETSAQNLGALCRRHHRLKTHGGWDLVSNSDGSCTWTSPENKQYFVPARDAQEAV